MIKNSHELNLLNEDLSLPCAVLYQSRIDNNLNWMQRFADKNNVKLAPHGKTSMMPALFQQQIAAGAWAITLATAPQVMSAYQQGIKRLLMANQLVGKQNMQLIFEVISDPDVEFYCVVDSVENVVQLGEFFQHKQKNINVLIELGVPAGRCGCRTDEEIEQVIQAIKTFNVLHLSGIEFYEGVIHGENEVTLINAFLQSAIKLTHRLIAQDQFTTEAVLLTGAGSAWYDLVAESFDQAKLHPRIIPIIRPGCYAIHDTGIYEQAQNSVLKRSKIACSITSELGSDLQSSLEVWAYVQSIPEPGHIIVTMGKRDVAFDAGLPTATLIYRPGADSPRAINEGCVLTQIMDQHAYLSCPDKADIKVGDMIAFSTSHPCLTFDKWREIVVINNEYTVQNSFKTYF